MKSGWPWPTHTSFHRWKSLPYHPQPRPAVPPHRLPIRSDGRVTPTPSDTALAYAVGAYCNVRSGFCCVPSHCTMDWRLSSDNASNLLPSKCFAK